MKDILQVDDEIAEIERKHREKIQRLKARRDKLRKEEAERLFGEIEKIPVFGKRPDMVLTVLADAAKRMETDPDYKKAMEDQAAAAAPAKSAA